MQLEWPAEGIGDPRPFLPLSALLCSTLGHGAAVGELSCSRKVSGAVYSDFAGLPEASVLFFLSQLASGTSIRTGLGRNYSSLSEKSILPCKKEALECGKGLCLLNWLHCHYQKNCGREFMAIKLTCSSPDSSSYGGSNGELQSACIEEFSPAFDLGSYMETMSQVNIGYPDSPPCYDECVGPRATQIYIPTDDPPPYSMADPCRNASSMSISLEEMTPGVTENVLDGSVQVEGSQLPLSSISFSTVTFGVATHYKNTATKQSRSFPLIPLDTPKNSTPQSHASSNRIM
uniref:Protein BEAN1 isoform X3 n=1 Tax=Geotrypetes seraphini TaxID=260995 RepID=A0A6P8R7X5_GEOSA|nr:protein BEAN1 isoform X3 [Geotrypetes seraphini]